MDSSLREEIRALFSTVECASVADVRQRTIDFEVSGGEPMSQEELTWVIVGALTEPDANGLPLALGLTSEPLPKLHDGPATPERVRQKIRLIKAMPWLPNVVVDPPELALLDEHEARAFVETEHARMAGRARSVSQLHHQLEVSWPGGRHRREPDAVTPAVSGRNETTSQFESRADDDGDVHDDGGADDDVPF